MNVLHLRFAILLAAFCCIISCKDEAVTPSLSLTKGDKSKASLATPTIIFPPGGHFFSDIHICYDDKVFLLEAGRLKRLIGNNLVEVQLPASVYKDFDPKFLTISKDYTFYLRSDTGIKIIKGGKEIGFYRVGTPPLQSFTRLTFGNFSLESDESDHSIVFGTVRFTEDSLLFAVAKITREGKFTEISFPNVEEQFITSFGLGASTGELWSGNLETDNNSYFGGLLKSAVSVPPGIYGNAKSYGQRPSTHIGFPTEGPINDVEFGVLAGITVSKDSKVVYFKTGRFGEDDDNPIGIFGDVFKIQNGIVTMLAKGIEDKRLAVSNDGKALYIAGKGLAKIEL